MHVVGCGDDDGVDIFLAVEHFAKVGVARGFRQMNGFQLEHAVDAGLGFDRIKRRGGFTGPRRCWELDTLFEPLDIDVEVVEALIGIAPVHVAKGDDVLAGEIDQIGAAHSADANSSNVQRVAGRSESATEDASGNDGARGTTGGDFGQKGAA